MKTLAALAGLLVGGCGSVPVAHRAEAPAAGAVVGHLQARDRRVTIRSTTDGPRFTVRANDGAVLADGITAAELQAQQPELFRAVETGVAQGPLDATLYRRASSGRDR
jgi:hypothetical protein